MGLRREKWIFEGFWHVRAGEDHQTLKMVENIENCLNHISKGSISMFASQFDMCLYIVKKGCKARLKNKK